MAQAPVSSAALSVSDASMNSQILEDIRQLQLTERSMLEFLDANKNTLTADQKNTLAERVNGLVGMRYRMYQSIGMLNSFYDEAVKKTIAANTSQSIALGVMERELDRMKKEYTDKQERNTSQVRMIQISDYYADRYRANTELIKILIYTLLPIIFLTFLHNAELLADTLFYVSVGVVSAVGAFYFWIKLMNINKRSNMDFDAYNYPKPSGDGKATVTDEPAGGASAAGGSWRGTGAACVGAACCSDNQEFKNNQCVPLAADAATVAEESFKPMMSGAGEWAYTRKQSGKIKPDVVLGKTIGFSMAPELFK